MQGQPHIRIHIVSYEQTVFIANNREMKYENRQLDEHYFSIQSLARTPLPSTYIYVKINIWLKIFNRMFFFACNTSCQYMYGVCISLLLTTF